MRGLIFYGTMVGLWNPWLALVVGIIMGFIVGWWVHSQVAQRLRKRRQQRILYRIDQEQKRDPDLARKVEELVDLDETDDQETNGNAKTVE